jgi:hypothetical protein
MARLRQVALWILVASAAFLNAASGQTPRPGPQVTESLSGQRKEAPEHNQAQPQPAPTANSAKPEPPHGDASPGMGRTDIHQSKRSWVWTIWTWTSGMSAQGFFTFVVAAATVAIAVFTWLLWRATDEMKKASADSASAAKKSAQVAELALHVDRPFLLVESAKLDGVVEPTFAIPGAAKAIWGPLASGDMSLAERAERLKGVIQFSPNAAFTFKNYGKGPAILKDAVAGIVVLAELPPARDFSGLNKLFYDIQAIGAEESWTTFRFYQWGTITGEQQAADVAAIASEAKRLIVYGRVRYQDVFKDDYETGFCWLFRPPSGLLQISSFTVGPETHNYST